MFCRDRDKTVRFSAEVGIALTGDHGLCIDAPDTMYTDQGEVVATDEYNIIRERVSRALQQLGITEGSCDI